MENRQQDGKRALTPAEIRARAIELRTAELEMPERLFYLSFADDDGFLGGIIVEARGMMTALDCINQLGINPGGEVLCVPFKGQVLPELCYRLLSCEELEYAFGKVKRIQS